jgi:hypothetical protein
MKKEELINIIEALYPADSQFSDTEKIGKALLDASMHEAHFNWRYLPESVLKIYAEKCEALEKLKERNDRGFKVKL